MNLPPMLSVPIIYIMLEGSGNLHKQCLHYGRCPASLLADRPTASACFCTCRPLFPSPSFCCIQLRMFCSFYVSPLDILRIIKLCTTAKTKNTTSTERNILVSEASWYDSLSSCSFMSCRRRRLASYSRWRSGIVEHTCVLSRRKQIRTSG